MAVVLALELELAVVEPLLVLLLDPVLLEAAVLVAAALLLVVVVLPPHAVSRSAATATSPIADGHLRRLTTSLPFAAKI